MALERRSNRRRREILLAYLLAVPAFLFVLGVLAYPVAWQGWTSLTNRSPLLEGPPAFVGLGNYVGLLDDREYWRAVGHTGAYFAITTPRPRRAGPGSLLVRESQGAKRRVLSVAERPCPRRAAAPAVPWQAP